MNKGTKTKAKINRALAITVAKAVYDNFLKSKKEK
jgi:hypothetical protein